ncbi:hypothetical protein E2542_SST15989 [Spatholobus suberectus]|nr:hypothetical protein E2542_SST15989 [Spatholobus suberectus]
MQIYQHKHQRKRNKESNDVRGREGQEGNGDGLDGGYELHGLTVEEVENAIGDADDSTVGQDQSEKGIQEMKEESVGSVVCCWRWVRDVAVERVVKVGTGGREEEEKGEREEEDEGESLNVTRVCFEDVPRFRNDVPEVVWGHCEDTILQG